MKRFVLDQIIDMWGTNESGHVGIYKNVMIFCDQDLIRETLPLIEKIPPRLAWRLVALNVAKLVGKTLPTIEFLWVHADDLLTVELNELTSWVESFNGIKCESKHNFFVAKPFLIKGTK